MQLLVTLGDPNSNSGKFVHNPDEIAGFFQSQMLVFVKFLQENYLNNIRTLEEATVASDILSLTNVLNSDWQVSLDGTSVLLMQMFVLALFIFAGF